MDAPKFRNGDDPMWPGAIFNAVVKERQHQNKTYGPIDEAGGHDLTGWLLIIEKELNEAKDAATGKGKRQKTGRNTTRAEILQIMAVCCAALEQHGLETGPMVRICPGTSEACVKGCGAGELCVREPAT